MGMFIPPDKALFELAEDNQDPSAMEVVQEDREETEGSLSCGGLDLSEEPCKADTGEETPLQRRTEHISSKFGRLWWAMGRAQRPGIGNTWKAEAGSTSLTAVILLLLMGTVYWLQN